MANELRTFTVLEMSTAHLSDESVILLDGPDEGKVLRMPPNAVGGQHHWVSTGSGTVCSIPDAFGWWVYAHDDRMPGMNDNLWCLFEFARSLGCSWVRFDRDGLKHPDLKTYRDEVEGK